MAKKCDIDIMVEQHPGGADHGYVISSLDYSAKGGPASGPVSGEAGKKKAAVSFAVKEAKKLARRCKVSVLVDGSWYKGFGK